MYRRRIGDVTRFDSARDVTSQVALKLLLALIQVEGLRFAPWPTQLHPRGSIQASTLTF